MKKFIPLFGWTVLMVVVFGTIYTISQQMLRQAANDPQIQLAQDAASALKKGVDPRQLVTTKVDMATSLAPFVNIYDRDGHIVTGSGYLGTTLPVVPKGILTSADNRPYNAVTWQPTANARIASIEVAAGRYYVLAGRSLKEVEMREAHTLTLVLVGACVSFIVIAVIFWPKEYRPQKQTRHS